MTLAVCSCGGGSSRANAPRPSVPSYCALATQTKAKFSAEKGPDLPGVQSAYRQLASAAPAAIAPQVKLVSDDLDKLDPSGAGATTLALDKSFRAASKQMDAWTKQHCGVDFEAG